MSNSYFRFSLASLPLTFTPDDDHPSASSLAQEQVETMIYDTYRQSLLFFSTNALSSTTSNNYPTALTLQRDKHVSYLNKLIRSLSTSMTSLSASRPWIIYWILHSLDLLSNSHHNLLSTTLTLRAITTLLRFQHPNGGFGGGLGQFPHLAANYAAIHALAITRDSTAWQHIDRSAMYQFFMRCKQPNGSFIVCDGGEVDIRGTYCALTVARLLNIMTPELTANCIDFIVKCQSHDGGIAATPYLESHGGYTFCGLAAALLLGESSKLSLNNLLAWSIRRQMPMEGGFQGRPNKLVDGCYSWWVGGLFALLDSALTLNSCNYPNHHYVNQTTLQPNMSWNRDALQEYILMNCQSAHGGLLDKPDKYPDPYHTCYVLSGLSAAQFCYRVSLGPNGNGDLHFASREDQVTVIGPIDNLLHPIDPIHNIRLDALHEMLTYFAERPLPPEMLQIISKQIS